MFLKKILARQYRAADPDESGTGEDLYGNEWVPTPEEEDEPPKKKVAVLEKPLPKTKAAAKAELTAEEEPTDPEEEPEEEPSEDGSATDKDKPKTKARIPLDRHEAILAKERAKREELEAKVKNFQGAAVVQKVNAQITELEGKLEGLDTQYQKAMADGEVAQAAALAKQIRGIDRQISEANADVRIAAAEARAVETTRYAVALERIEAAYPELDENADEFDKETYDEVLDLFGAYRAKGLTPTDSLQKATKMVMRGKQTAKQEAATTVKPRVELTAKEAKEIERKTGATEKAVKAKNGSPATATAKAGVNSNSAGANKTAKDIMQMSQKEFAKYSEENAEEMARLRGDFLEVEEE